MEWLPNFLVSLLWMNVESAKFSFQNGAEERLQELNFSSHAAGTTSRSDYENEGVFGELKNINEKWTRKRREAILPALGEDCDCDGFSGCGSALPEKNKLVHFPSTSEKSVQPFSTEKNEPTISATERRSLSNHTEADLYPSISTEKIQPSVTEIRHPTQDGDGEDDGVIFAEPFDDDDQSYRDSEGSDSMIVLKSAPSKRSSHCRCVPVLECGFSYKNFEKDEPNPCSKDEACCQSAGLVEEERDLPQIPDASSQREDESLENQKSFETPLLCGQSLTDAEVRGSEGGSDRAKYREFPWTVFISHTDPKKDFRCAGTLIRPNIVLTAANCLFGSISFPFTARLNFDHLIVYGGAWDLVDPQPVRPEIRSIDTYMVHPNFQVGKTLSNNIALLRLSRPFHLSTDINIACLASSLLEVDLDSCVANGWGREPKNPSEGRGLGNKAKVMKKVWLPVIQRNECQEKLQRYTSLGKTFRIGDGLFCAGGERGVDMCQGDGGGPLLCPSRSSRAMIQIGLIAGGVGCGRRGVPGFITDVTYYNDWIKESIDRLAVF